MFDRYNRNINYLRISVTDRCNLRCNYCMPAEGIRLIRHDDILSYEEIIDATRTAVSMGITKVRITGGEPLVRKGILRLVEQLTEIRGIIDLGMTTNGILLKEFAKPLARAGLHRINISLDTMDPEEYRAITRGGELQQVLDGIMAAKEAGLRPIKLNCVIEHSSREPRAVAVAAFGAENGLEVRFIHKMDLENGCFTVVENGDGGDCGKCTRLRLTANGLIKPCLFSNEGFSIRKLGVKTALELAVGLKPEKGTVNDRESFHYLGG